MNRLHCVATLKQFLLETPKIQGEVPLDLFVPLETGLG